MSKQRSKISTLNRKKKRRSPFLFSVVLAVLFSARVLFTPSRQTKSKAMLIDLDSQVYEPNR
ncbi:hypothetical protein [Bacillus thuringiensis]|uniref:hypothetical protein n=1 Tax=Bacillus thuringiensis TaxID=1428 RepID=UPI001E5683CC|nr:hypothetical protein [Bacillus thuringiensis]